MSKCYVIRPATTEDEKDILKLSRYIADSYTRSYLGDKTVNWYIDSGSCDEDMKKEIANTTLLLLHGFIIGIMIWHDNQMHGFMIDVPYHGTGVAQYFCEQMIPEKLKQYGEIYLECFDKNQRAIAFYEKTGWREFDRVKDEIIDGYRIIFKIIK